MIKRMLQALLLWTVTSTALAEGNAPDIAQWVAKVKAKPRDKQEFRYPERILIVRDPRAKGAGIFPRISPAVFNRLGMFEIGDHAQVALQFQLNQRPHESRWAERSADNLTRGSMPILFDIFDVDLIVAVPNVGPWEVYDALNEQALISDDNPPKDKLSANNINTWLNGRVGYDAYVVDQAGSYVLLKSQAKLMQQGLQALVLKDSNEDFILTDKKSKGSAILQSVTSLDQYGVYKVVLSDESVEQLVPGTKIILERPVGK